MEISKALLNQEKIEKLKIENNLIKYKGLSADETDVHRLLLSVSQYVADNDPVQHMENVVTDVLQSLIGSEIKRFVIENVEKRNQIETYFYIIKEINGRDVRLSVTSACGGGVLDAAFFIIRLVMLVCHPSKPRRILIADEPVKNLSVCYRDKFMSLVSGLAKEFGIQIIMTTHEKEYIKSSDQVIEFTLEDGVTYASC